MKIIQEYKKTCTRLKFNNGMFSGFDSKIEKANIKVEPLPNCALSVNGRVFIEKLCLEEI